MLSLWIRAKKSFWNGISAGCAIAALTLAPISGKALPTYSGVVDLGLQGGTWSRADDINNSNEVVGKNLVGGQTRVQVWNGTTNAYVGSLGSENFNDQGSFIAVNDAGTVAGNWVDPSRSPFQSAYRASISVPGSMTSLSTPPGVSSYFRDLGENDRVAGGAFGSPPGRVWDTSTLGVVALATPPLAGYPSSVAQQTDFDIALGSSYGSGATGCGYPQCHSTYWTGVSSGTPTAVDPGTMGFDSSFLVDFVSSTTFLGQQTTSGVGSGFVYDSTNASVVTLLNPTGSTQSYVLEAAGNLVVGFALMNSGPLTMVPVVWDVTDPMNVTSAVLPCPTGAKYCYAVGINDAGWVVGGGDLAAQGTDTALLWQPVPEASTALLITLGATLLGVKRQCASRD
jgi:hypothetical protein